jgi:FKBP-type peptidyl-prolyl cis-trans isomerase SlyD
LLKGIITVVVVLLMERCNIFNFYKKDTMEIGRNKFVSLTYQLRLNGADGEMIEETTNDSPLEFLFGAGRMIEMFEQKLESMKAGDSFNFELKADEAYGQVNNDAIVELPKNIFEVNGAIDEEMLTVGNSIPMQDAQGNRLNGIVLELTDENVKMDFNHPLAGEDLHFSGAVLAVREATEDELVEAAGCGSDGCNSGGCGSGCSC